MKLAGEVFHAKNQDCPPSETFVRKHVIFTGGLMSWEQNYCNLPPHNGTSGLGKQEQTAWVCAELAWRGCLGKCWKAQLKALLTSDTALLNTSRSLINTHQTLTHLTVSALLLYALKCLPLILQPLFCCSPLEY